MKTNSFKWLRRDVLIVFAFIALMLSACEIRFIEGMGGAKPAWKLLRILGPKMFFIENLTMFHRHYKN